MNKTYGVIGGDRRQAELARLLRLDGSTVYTYGLGRWKATEEVPLDQAVSADIIILPLPLCKGDGVLNCEEGAVPTIELFRRLRPRQRILAGQVRPAQQREAEACGLRLEDYFLREELTVANAAATAEGAIQTAMEQLDLFTDVEAAQAEKKAQAAELAREKKLQEAMLSIKSKYGKNAILKGTNLVDGTTAAERNGKIGGHKA